jgi:hypothetical protein
MAKTIKKTNLLKGNFFLYLSFIIALLNIGYFIMLEEYQTIISFIVIISVCSMFTKNLLLLLLFGIAGMNIFFVIKYDSIENMDNINMDMSYNSFKDYVINSINTIDPSKLDKDNKEFVLYIKSNKKMDPKEYYTEFKNKYREMSDTKWIDKNIVNFKEIIIVDEVYNSGEKNKNEKYDRNMNESFDVKNNQTNEKNIDSNEDIEGIMNKLKETTPELSQSLDVLNKIDINEMNKLINKMNTILQSSSA